MWVKQEVAAEENVLSDVENVVRKGSSHSPARAFLGNGEVQRGWSTRYVKNSIKIQKGGSDLDSRGPLFQTKDFFSPI